MKRSISFDVEGWKTAKAAELSRPINVTSEDEQEFFLALSDYKKQSGRLFPTCSEILEVLKALGYAKRIWKPVALWPSHLSGPSDDFTLSRESLVEFGWYSNVETSVVP